VVQLTLRTRCFGKTASSRDKPAPARAELFKDIRPGDLVTVDWGRKEPSPEYGAGGEVVQVTNRFVTIRTSIGYLFSVSLAHVIAGAKIKVTGRGQSLEGGSEDRMAGIKFEHLNPETQKKVLEVATGDPVNETGPVGDDATAAALSGENLQPDQPGEAPTPEVIVRVVPPAVNDEAAPTPLECVERGLSLTQARVMTPKDLTREAAERLLASGVAKKELVRLYGFSSPQVCYMKLARFGLHKGTRPKAPKPAAKDPPAEKPQRRNGMDLPLPMALSLRDRFRANLRAVEDIFLHATSGPLRLSEDIIRDLTALQTKYAAELTKIESAFGSVKVSL
jgi:hypothetical protein